jgi:hypothetical protein
MSKFYVYQLVDPRSDEVFYVGKGCGRRSNDHERDARRGVESDKCERIRDILAAGHKVAIVVVSRHADEQSAYAAERALIEKIGLENLTNVLPGGSWSDALRSLADGRATRAKLDGALFGLAWWHKTGCATKANLGPIGTVDLRRVARGWVEQVRDLSSQVGKKDARKIAVRHGATAWLDAIDGAPHAQAV